MPTESATAFDEAGVLAEAREAAALDDFGDAGFRVPLRALLSSLADAPLNAMGIGLMRGSIVKSLITRLRAVDWFTRHPEIAGVDPFGVGVQQVLDGS